MSIALLSAVALSACGGAELEASSDVERLRDRGGPTLYYLGESYDGLPLTHAESREPGNALFVYGDCDPGPEGGCAPPVQIQQTPIASPDRYGRWRGCMRMTIRGAPAAQFDGFEVYVGDSLVKVYARDSADSRRAATQLRSIDGTISQTDPLPAPSIDVRAPLAQCATDSMEEKLAEVRSAAALRLYWAGRRFEGHPLFHVDGNGRWVRFLYGACKTVDVPGTCWPALTLELTPLGESRPGGWSPSIQCDVQRIRGAFAAGVPAAHELVLFTGDVVVHVNGPDLDLLRRAAEALRPLDDADPGSTLPPPPASLVEELRRVCRA